MIIDDSFDSSENEFENEFEFDTNITEQELKKSLEDLNHTIEISMNSFKQYLDRTIKEITNFKFTEQYFIELSKMLENIAKNVISKETLDKLVAEIKEIAKKGNKKALEDKLSSYITAVTERQKMEFLKSIIPKNFYITNNKLSNEMTKNFTNGGEISLAIINPNQKNEIRTYNSLTYDNKNISITGRQEFTAYDRAIHNAVCSLYAAGNDVVTPAMVYRTVNGMSDTDKVSPQAIETVKNSLDKSRFLRLRINFSAEAKARNINIDKAEIDSYLLPATALTVEAGGNKVDAYKILSIPALYQYAQYTKQILSVPLELLDTKDATRNTEDIIPIKEYLIRRIEVMKHNRDMSNKILYDTIFKEVGIVITDKKQRNRLRSYITAILDLWKTRDKYIKNFEEYKEGNAFKGIEIIY